MTAYTDTWYLRGLFQDDPNSCGLSRLCVVIVIDSITITLQKIAMAITHIHTAFLLKT